MENLINWFEIPATNFNGTVFFHKAILSLEIEESKMGYFGMFIDTKGTNKAAHSIH